MTKKWYQEESFLKEQRKWYKKLERSGFNDIEYLQEDGSSGNLLKGTATTTAALTRKVKVRKGEAVSAGGVGNTAEDGIQAYRDKEAYFQWAGAFYWHMQEAGYPKKEVEVWYQHQKGETNAAIRRIFGMKKDDLNEMLDRLKANMLEYLQNEVE